MAVGGRACWGSVMTEPCDHDHRCPECGVPLLTLMGKQKLIALHRDSSGKRCEASGRSLIHYRWIDLFKAVTGREPRV